MDVADQKLYYDQTPYLIDFSWQLSDFFAAYIFKSFRG